mmetsp:Transcript_16431/g.24842  ORF Transcript_16431/g.24842 Transcript_16431/m.24842 type:complete len:86 (-) Transcript_16431:47-304(-)
MDDDPVSSEEPPLLNATISVPANITGDFYDDFDWNEMPTEAQQLWAKLGSTKSSGIMVTLNLFGASIWIGTIFQSKLRMLQPSWE